MDNTATTKYEKQIERILARKRRDDEIRMLRSMGWTLQRISDKFGITRERVNQICKENQDARD